MTEPIFTNVFGGFFSPSRRKQNMLKLCNIWGFHGSDYEKCRLLGSYTVWLLWEPTFRRNLAPPSSRWQ
jgi:hypothetical protein